jgi:hypothetical protein
MKLDVPHDYVPLLITALEHHYTYTKAVRREDTRYQQAADWFHRQSKSIAQKRVRTVKRKADSPRVRRPYATSKVTHSAPDGNFRGP